MHVLVYARLPAPSPRTHPVRRCSASATAGAIVPPWLSWPPASAVVGTTQPGLRVALLAEAAANRDACAHYGGRSGVFVAGAVTPAEVDATLSC